MHSRENNKSPGFNGLTTNFYKLLFLITLWYKSPHGLPAARCHIIIKGDHTLLKNWRPAILLNTDYTIFTNMPTNRLQQVLPLITLAGGKKKYQREQATTSDNDLAQVFIQMLRKCCFWTKLFFQGIKVIIDRNCRVLYYYRMRHTMNTLVVIFRWLTFWNQITKMTCSLCEAFYGEISSRECNSKLLEKKCGIIQAGSIQYIPFKFSTLEVAWPGWSEDTAARISRELLRRELRQTQHHNRSDNEGTTAQSPHEDEQRFEGEIEKEINKFKYFLKEADDLM